MKRVSIFGLLAVLLLPAQPAQSQQRVLEASLKHLRSGEGREWADFPEEAEGASLTVGFKAEKNAAAQTLLLRQLDVKQAWKILLNGRELGRLRRNENDMVIAVEVPAGALAAGDNTISIEPAGVPRSPDDIRVGAVVLDSRPPGEALGEARVSITVRDADRDRLTPCRITVLNAEGALMTVGAESNDSLAVRPGVIYTGGGKAEFGLPAGTYTVYAGRGFEYGVDSVQFTLKPGENAAHTLEIAREVPTAGWVACDTHVHTLTHSGHGDASIEERMLTIAGEGIELPIATDHNKHIDYEPVARRLNVRQYFTPVIGNEYTTRVGHFNVFPVEADARIPDPSLTDWQQITEEIFGTPGVKAAILNHARDLHSGFRPFGPKHHNSVVGRNLDGWELGANAMELINSGAQQSDVMQLYRDWFGLLNRGLLLTPVGSSDSHDVARHFVGQGRTYIRCDDADPAQIDVGRAVENFLAGKVMVSCGLLAEITLNDQYGPGDVAPNADEDLAVGVRVLGPAWTTAEVVELYMNGRKVREEKITDGAQPGVKFSGGWSLPRPRHDVHLVAVARGPGVKELYWPIAKPYQPDSPIVKTQVVGSSGAVWFDADADGKRTAAFDYAQRIVQQSGAGWEVVDVLIGYDTAVAAQAAVLLDEEGLSLTDAEAQKALQKAPPQVREGFQSYLEARRETQRARLEQ